MTWPFAIFASFSVLVISVLVFLLIIYFKEYKREEKLIKQLGSMKEEDFLPPIYVMAPPAKKSAPEPQVYHKTDKNKKNIN